MYIARLLYPIEVLGPGKRIGIWFCGCPHHCPGCSNPELWDFDESRKISLEHLLVLIKQIADSNPVDGFTITGGEPFYQANDLKLLVKELQSWSDDILVFSGYYKEEVEQFADLENIAVLIDGPYIKNRNKGLTLRGSDNQTIHILNSKYNLKYEKYLSENNSKIQNFLEGQSVISVGIHKPDYENEVKSIMEQKGLYEENKSSEQLYI